MTVNIRTEQKQEFFSSVVLIAIVLTGLLLVCLHPATAASSSSIVSVDANIVYMPTARFTANITEGAAPLPVKFSDQSDGYPDVWKWDFGDGTNSTDQNPTHTYASGIYTVNLTVANAAGFSEKIQEKYITAYAKKITQTYTTTTGLTQTSSAISLNKTDFATSGSTQTLSGNALTITYPAGSAFSKMTINLDAADTSNGNIAGNVQSVVLESTPTTGTLPSSGESETHTIKLQLGSVPSSGAAITTTIIEGADTESKSKIDAFASSSGLTLLDTKYELVVSTSGLSVQSAVITMEVPSSWYSTYSSKTVRMMRKDNAGSISMLDTTFSGFDGTNAIYTGNSPNGLSTFGMSAFSGSTSSSQTSSSSSSSSGSSDSSSGGVSAGTGQAAQQGIQQPAQVNLPGVIQGPGKQQAQPPPSGVERPELLAPAEGSLVSQAIDLSRYSQFISADSSGRQHAVFDRQKIGQSGATMTVSGNIIEIHRTDYTMKITADSVTDANGVVKADAVQSIQLTTTPVETDMDGVGHISSSFTAGLASVPENAGITSILAVPVNQYVIESFQSSVAREGDELSAVAYTLTVRKTNIATSSPATIQMSIPADWVTAHGGIDSIVIGRIGDDQTEEILQTSYTGYDQNRNMVFEAKSPHGLSVFGLIATKGQLRPRIGQPAFLAVIYQVPILSKIMQVIAGVIAAIGVAGVIILVLLVITVIVGLVSWQETQAKTKKTNMRKK
jgi:PKD repeat protein